MLLATFNGERYLNQQIESIKNQSNVDTLVLASDDCSTDRTLQLLNKTITNDSHFKLLPIQKLGGAAANFFRLLLDADYSNADYIALSDQDDIWHSDKLSHAIRELQERNIDAYSSNVTAFWPNGKKRLINKAQLQQKWDYMFESAGPGCTFVFTKNFALAIQQFLRENQEVTKKIALHDWFIYAFARSRGYKWFIDTTSCVLYRQHDGNVVGANEGFKAKLNRWKMLREGWLVNQALLLAKILNYEDVWPILKLQRYHFVDRLALISNIIKLRRRWRDCFAFALFLLLPLKK